MAREGVLVALTLATWQSRPSLAIASPSPHSQADLALFLHSALLLQLADRGSLSDVLLHPLARPVARRQARD
jgi:hypothetical protein